MRSTGTRACSWCGKPGHDKRSCDVPPNAASVTTTGTTSETARASRLPMSVGWLAAGAPVDFASQRLGMMPLRATWAATGLPDAKMGPASG